MKVATAKGELEAAELELRDLIEWSEGARLIATEWFFKGELVRRDVWVNPLLPIEIGVRQ